MVNHSCQLNSICSQFRDKLLGKTVSCFLDQVFKSGNTHPEYGYCSHNESHKVKLCLYFYFWILDFVSYWKVATVADPVSDIRTKWGFNSHRKQCLSTRNLPIIECQIVTTILPSLTDSSYRFLASPVWKQFFGISHRKPVNQLTFSMYSFCLFCSSKEPYRMSE